MMPKVALRPFGPIRDVEIEVNDLMIFIGPQASGKSTISKSIYYFKSLRDDLLKYLFEAQDKQDFKKPLGSYAKRIRAKFIGMWGPSAALGDFDLQYEYGNGVQIHVGMKGNWVDPQFNDEFTRKFQSILEEARNLGDRFARKSPEFLSSTDILAVESEKRSGRRRLVSLTNDLFNDHRDVLFIPAGRSLMATLADQLQEVHPQTLDCTIRAFMDRINRIRPLFSKSLTELVTDKKKLTQETILFDELNVANRIIEKVIKATYKCDADGEKLFYDSRNYTKLIHSSSGQQETIWTVLLLFLIILENQEVFIVIEEPEAHLYPEAQQEVVHLISLLGNVRRNQIVITTHSPYILSAMNNLLYAYNIGQKKSSQAREIVEKRLWLAPKRLSVYFIENGKAEDIMDGETGLIKAEKIDSASEKINEVYDALFELDAV